jgi:hypothetical protein
VPPIEPTEKSLLVDASFVFVPLDDTEEDGEVGPAPKTLFLLGI